MQIAGSRACGVSLGTTATWENTAASRLDTIADSKLEFKARNGTHLALLLITLREIAMATRAGFFHQLFLRKPISFRQKPQNKMILSQLQLRNKGNFLFDPRLR
jgi:hypothetical protein